MRAWKEILGCATTIGCSFVILAILVSLLFVPVVRVREPNMIILFIEIVVVMLGLVFSYNVWKVRLEL